MTPRAWFGIALLACLVSYGAGRFATPTREETKVTTVERVRLQEVVKVKVVTEVAKDEHSKGVANTKKTTLPNGTVIEEGQVVWDDRARETTKQQLSLEIHTTEQKDTKKEETHIVTHDAPRLNLFVGVGVSASLFPLGVSPQYIVGGQYRAWGSVGVGGWATFEQGGLRPAGGVLVGLSL